MKKEKNNGKIIIQISIMWIFFISIIIALILAFFKDNIFATDMSNETSSNENISYEIVSGIEKNQNAVDVLKLMIENNYSNKKLVNEERKIDYEVQRQETDKLAKGEEKVVQKGEKGIKQVTVLQTYENNNIVDEQIIETIVKKVPVMEVIYVGTSQFLSKYSVNIGDEMYLIEAGEIKKEENIESETIISLRRYLNVILLGVSGEWAKIKYDSYEGYIQTSKLTSESVTPKIAEKNRIAKLQTNLKFDMNINKPSGLTLNDYKTVFGYNASDKNGIFAECAEIFYKIEQEYKINGIFVAAIGIHESAWGTSTLAKEKFNLFGYKAYDRDPENSAQAFESYEDCITTVSKALASKYLSETGSFYNGATLEGVNVKYASDEDWAKKVYAYMEYLYDKLG